MLINLIYILVVLIFSFLLYLILKSIVIGVNEKNKDKK